MQHERPDQPSVRVRLPATYDSKRSSQAIAVRWCDRDGAPALQMRLEAALHARTPLDTVIWVTNDQSEPALLRFVNAFRLLVHPELLYATVDLSGTSKSMVVQAPDHDVAWQHPNDIVLSGYSDQVRPWWGGHALSASVH
jgi:hypothetical protein